MTLSIVIDYYIKGIESMLYTYKGICQNCATEISVTIHNGELLEDCPDCKDVPFSLKKFTGLVYVVSNPNQTGVKIGMTEKTVESRIKSLNTTGVAGNFKPIVIFPCERPKPDEKKIHEKLSRFNIAKEHFELEPVEAALKCYRALNRRKPIFYDKIVEEMFHLRLEQDKINMKIKLKGKNNH